MAAQCCYTMPARAGASWNIAPASCRVANDRGAFASDRDVRECEQRGALLVAGKPTDHERNALQYNNILISQHRAAIQEEYRHTR